MKKNGEKKVAWRKFYTGNEKKKATSISNDLMIGMIKTHTQKPEYIFPTPRKREKLRRRREISFFICMKGKKRM